MTDEELHQLIANAPTKSESIRRLFLAGMSKADIGRFMGLRYQHVYNVLLREDKADKQGSPAISQSNVETLEVDAAGQVQLPADFIKTNGLDNGGTLYVRRDPQGLTLMSREAVLDALRDVARKRMPDHAALLDALLGDPRGIRETKAGKDTP